MELSVILPFPPDPPIEIDALEALTVLSSVEVKRASIVSPITKYDALFCGTEENVDSPDFL